MSDAITIEATIEQVRGVAGRGGPTVRVDARYESAGTIGNLSMDFPTELARSLYVGRLLTIRVSLAQPEQGGE